MNYYSPTNLCLLGSIMRANHKWGAVSKMYSESFICHCNPAGKAYLDKGPLFPFSSCFAQSDYRVLIRKCRLLNLLFFFSQPLASDLPGLHSTVFCIETRGISGISIRTGQLFLCGYNAAGSSLIAPPLRHSSHTVIQCWKILECQWLCCLSLHTPGHLHT